MGMGRAMGSMLAATTLFLLPAAAANGAALFVAADPVLSRFCRRAL